MFRRFRQASPEPKGELEYVNPYTLLVAVVLSAQATDAGVNKATRRCSRSPTRRRRWWRSARTRCATCIKTIGLLSQQGQERHRAVASAGRPSTAARCRATREALEALPGVGRKTANVVLNMAFGEPTIAVDTHIFRVGNRTGMAPGKTPLEVELELAEGRPGRIHAATRITG